MSVRINVPWTNTASSNIRTNGPPYGVITSNSNKNVGYSRIEMKPMIQTSDASLILFELEAFQAMTLVRKPLIQWIFSPTSDASLSLVELVTPQ
jgi:hypothetical protein